jgi:hypothetical protein
MRTYTIIAGAAAVAFAATPSLAHPGPRIWIGQEGGVIRTYTSDDDLAPTIFSLTRVFIGGGVEDVGAPTGLFDNPASNIFTTDFPGFERRTDGGGVADGTTFAFNIAGPLLAYDGAGFVPVSTLFGPPAPQILLNHSPSPNLFVTGAGFIAGENFLTTSPGAHSHIDITYFGNGTSASNGPDGIFALPLQLTSGSFTQSDTFWIVIGKGAFTYAAVAAAAQTLQPVPEPAWVLSAGVPVIGAMALVLRRRRG